jgi:hypothetical protein
MSHKIIVLTLDLQIGMFVSDLDRPWIETPFIMQGLLIESESQIATLQQYCQQVTVDRSRSIGKAYAPRDNGKDAPRAPGSLPTFNKVSDARPDDFADICRHMRLESFTRRYRYFPDLNPVDQQSQLESELLFSAPLVDDVKKTLRSIRENISQSQNVSLKEMGSQVSEMARAVERNPDAMLWLTRLRSTDQYSYDHAIDVSVHIMVFGRFLGLLRRRRQRRVGTNVQRPAATHGLVEIDEAGEGAEAGVDGLELRGIELVLGGKHGGVALLAFLELEEGQPYRCLQRLDGAIARGEPEPPRRPVAMRRSRPVVDFTRGFSPR